MLDQRAEGLVDATTVPTKQIVIAMGDGANAAPGAFDSLIRTPVLSDLKGAPEPADPVAVAQGRTASERRLPWGPSTAGK